MCGISAIYKYSNINDTDLHNLALMNEEMHYRGPDEHGVWNDAVCGLAHTRLSIIGLDNGRQPLFNEDESLVLICNGEIYNYIELKIELEQKGHHFRSDSDSEVILHLYEEYGVACLNELRGMFAFCLWDSIKKELFVARDRVGEKILYYSQLTDGFVFSTELKAILKYYIQEPQINGKCLAESIRYNFPIELQSTYVEQIKRLRAGEYALVNQNGMRLHRYWQKPESQELDIDLDEAKSKALSLLRESVKLCLRSDVPVAVLLSSGIDSCAVAALAKEAGMEVHAITAGYKGSFDCDERELAKRFAEEKGLIYHEVELDVSDFQSIFDEYIPYLDEPVSDVSSMSQFALYRKAKELGFTVLLSGIGGDELCYGYPYQNKIAETIKFKRDLHSFFPINTKQKKFDFLSFAKNNWRNILFDCYPQFLDDKIPLGWTYDDYMMFCKDTILRCKDDCIIDFNRIDVHYSFSSEATLDTVYDFTFTRFMNTLCLYLADRLGMANSMEVRAPLLDYQLVEYISSLPLSMKYKKDNPKYFMKEVMKEILPDYILNAPKRGFSPPFDYIKSMCAHYNYECIKGEYVFFNSMLSDKLLSHLKL